MVRFATVFVSVGLTAATAPVVAADAPAADPSAVTAQVLRDLGTALYSWLTDRIDATPANEQARLTAEAKAAWEAAAPVAKGHYLWSRKPMVPLDGAKLHALLAPKEGTVYLEKIPALDGWGHPLEVVGTPENLFGPESIALRSAGPNGRFEGPDYVIGAISPGDASDDLVWADGFFLRWPGGHE